MPTPCAPQWGRGGGHVRRLDVLVNNAGTFIPATIDEATVERSDATFGINVRGLFVATIAAAKHMQEGGRIIQIGSINADRMPFPGGASTPPSKGAVRPEPWLWRDLGPRGITINTVQPGPVDTELNPAFRLRDRAEGAHGNPALRSLGRGGAGRLSRRARGRHVTAGVFNIDGGFGA